MNQKYIYLDYTYTFTHIDIMKEAAIIFIILLLLLTIISIFGGSVTYMTPQRSSYGSANGNIGFETFDDMGEAEQDAGQETFEEDEEPAGQETFEEDEGPEIENYDGNQPVEEEEAAQGIRPSAYQLEEFASF
jgi:hypothetical protein